MRLHLKDICSFLKTRQLDAASLQELRVAGGDVPLLPSSKDYNWFTTREAAEPFIAYGPVITMGKARYANIKYCEVEFVSSNNMLIQSKNPNQLYLRYLYYYLRRHSSKVYVMGTTYPKFDLDRFNALSIPLPSLPEQKQIAALFDDLHAQMDSCRYAISLLDEQVKSLFNERWATA